MAPKRHEVSQYISSVTIILEASITKAHVMGNMEVTPLHVIDRIIGCHSTSILCIDNCLQCKALKLCISQAIQCIPVTSKDCLPLIRRSPPAFSNDLVTAINSLRGGEVSDMDDVKRLFVYLLDDATVHAAIERAGFSTSVIKNNMENFGTAFKCL